MQTLQCAIAPHPLGVTAKQSTKMNNVNSSLSKVVTAKSAQVDMRRINVDYDRFQPRSLKLRNTHVVTLCEVLDHGNELDPIKVWSDENDQLWVMDGHHRFAAYQRYLKKTPVGKRKVARRGKVRCEILRGDMARVRLHASIENNKDRLNLTRGEKSQAAWNIIRDGSSIPLAEVVGTGLVSARTAQTMKNTLNWLKEQCHKGELDEESADWTKARCLYISRNNDFEATRHDEAERRAVTRERLRKQVGYPIERVPPGDRDLVIEVVSEAMGEDDFEAAFRNWSDPYGVNIEDATEADAIYDDAGLLTEALPIYATDF